MNKWIGFVCLLSLIGCHNAANSSNPANSSTNPATSAGANPPTKTVINLRTQAKKLEAELLTKKEQFRQDTVDEHTKDINSYQFHVRRWGGWLEISIARGDEKFSQSFNMSLIKTVQLEHGHPPDLLGHVDYYASLVYTENGVETARSIGVGRECDLKDSQNWRWEVESATSSGSSYRSIYADRTENHIYFGGSMSLYTVNGCAIDYPSTPNYPRYAQDDVIHLGDLGDFFVPDGLGEKVYHQILLAREPKSARADEGSKHHEFMGDQEYPDDKNLILLQD